MNSKHKTTNRQYMVGDHRSDVLAGKSAGARSILVKTTRNYQDESPEADYIAESLTQVVEFVIADA